MLLQLSDRSPEPLHSQISRQVRAMILAGHLNDGDALTSIRAMAREQRVSVITVQRAYEDLEKEGLLHTRRGKGFFVSGISSERKLELARQRFVAGFTPLLNAALQEGLSLTRIRSIIKDTINSGSEPK